MPPPKRSSPLALTLALLATISLSGCATHQTASGGRETSLLGGAVTVASDANPAATPETSEASRPAASEKKTSLLWGLIKL